MQIIPVIDAPSQSLAVALGGQACRINIYQRSTGIYMDLYVADKPICVGVVARNLVKTVIDSYLGFVGDILWLDNHGVSDPSYPGLNDRFNLCYVTAKELATGVAE